MPKYTNITNFTRPLPINGKRIIVKPNDIIFSERELDLSIYNFLQKVDDTKQTSKVSEIPNNVVPKYEEIKTLKNDLIAVKKTVVDLSTSKDSEQIKTQLESVLKKLEIMKNALTKVDETATEALTVATQTSEAVKDLEKEVYENGSIVITGLDDNEGSK